MNAKNSSKTFLLGSVLLATAAGVAGYVLHEQYRPALLEIYVFNMKIGRSIFVRTPGDKRILIDGGGNSEIIRNITHILPFYSRRIDMVIATNEDPKNVTGLVEVLNRYSVDKVVVPAVTLQSLGLASTTNETYAAFIQSAQRKNIPILNTIVGDQITLDKEVVDRVPRPAVMAGVLFPVSPDRFAYSKASSPEIVMKLSYGGNSMLLLGNATAKIQKFIASQGTTTAEVLIVSNSASPADITWDFVSKVGTDYLIYSKTIAKSADKKKTSTKNKKADPFYSILDNHRFNVKVGGVKIVSDGIQLKVSTL